MRSVSIRQLDMKQATIPLGFEGENEFTEVRIDCKKTFDQHPNAVPSMTVTDPAGNKYPAVVTRDGDVVVWQLTAGDLTTKGYGEIQIEFIIDGTVIGKTDIARTRIERSIFPEGEAPEPVQNWIDEANQTLAEVEEAKQAFPAGGTTGQVLTKKSDEDYDTEWKTPQGGGGGTSNYNDLDNKPSINGVTLSGNKSLSDLSIPSQEDVNAKYTKPQGGIPASDIDPSAIPSPTSIIDDNAGEGDTNKVLSADKVTEITTGLSEAIENVEGQIAVVQTFTSDEVVNGIYSSTTGNINTDYKYGLSNSVPIYIGSNGKAKIKCNGYYIRAFRFPAEGVTGFTYTDYTADEVTLSGTSTLVRVAFTVRKDPSVSTALTSSEIADILSKLSVEKNMSAVIEDVEKEIGTIIGMKSVVPEKWVNAIYSSTTGRINYQYKYAISNEIKIPIRQNAVVRCPGYYIRAFRFSADSTSFDYIGYVADEVTLDPTSTLKYLGFSIRINPNSSTALTEEQIADIKSKVSVQILTTTTDDDLTEIGIPADAYFVGKALSNSAKNNCIIGRPSVYHSTNPTAVSFDETDYTDVYDAYDSLCVAYPKWIQKQTDIGTDADSNPICLYKLRLFNPIVGKVDPWSYNDGEKVNYWQDTFKYRRALLTSGAHGNEKCAVWGLLYFITDLLASSDEWASFIKGNYELDIIPVIDPWGYNNNSRNNKNDVNINRDYLSPTQPETQAVVDYIQSVKDEIFCSIDCHGTSGNYGYVSARQENPAFGEIMRVANAMFGATADDVATVATSMSISSDYYPYSYGCMSENEGTLHHYLYVNGVTEYAVTLEAPNKTGTNGGLATKYINEGLGNLLQGFLSIFKIV